MEGEAGPVVDTAVDQPEATETAAPEKKEEGGVCCVGL